MLRMILIQSVLVLLQEVVLFLFYIFIISISKKSRKTHGINVKTGQLSLSLILPKYTGSTCKLVFEHYKCLSF